MIEALKKPRGSKYFPTRLLFYPKKNRLPIHILIFYIQQKGAQFATLHVISIEIGTVIKLRTKTA